MLLTSTALLLLTTATSTIASLLPLPLRILHVPSSSSFQIDILARTPPHTSFVEPSSLIRRREKKKKSQDLEWLDRWRTEVDVEGERWELRFKPNHNLLHPSATLSSLDSSSPLDRHSVLAYEGTVHRLSPHSPHSSSTPEPIDGDDTSLGWARVLVVDAKEGLFSGAFSLPHTGIHHIQTVSNYLLHKHPLDPNPSPNSPLVIFRDQDTYQPSGLERRATNSSSSSSGCTHDDLVFNTVDGDNLVHKHRLEQMKLREEIRFARELEGDWKNLLGKRQRGDTGGGVGGISSDFSSTIGDSSGCPKTQKVVYTGVAADCAYVARYESPEAARTAILSNWNTASALYRSTFNVSLGIIDIFIPTSSSPNSIASCPTTASAGTSSSGSNSSIAWNVGCSDSFTLNDRLSAFSAWRGSARSGDEAGLWHLMSGCPSGSEVGVAWLGQVCVQRATDQGSQGIVSGTAVSTASRMEWQVVAHETGHNFGAIHDCSTGCPAGPTCCPLTTSTCDSGGQYIMSPVSRAAESSFSPCSIGNICSVMQTAAVSTSCFVDPPGNVPLISLQQCGNGILEPGEDCDPGSNASSRCCDPATCRFRAGAVCDPFSSTCCTDQCSFAAAGVVCRSSRGECDIEETCGGTNSTCPEDRTQDDGRGCGASGEGLSCASGVCTSRDLQCRTVGASLGITSACPSSTSSSCSITCRNPQSPNSCLILQSSFTKGTRCGLAGRCNENGDCISGGLNSLDAAKNWENKKISIPVTVVVGILVIIILIAIIRCFVKCCTRKPQRSTTAGGPRISPANSSNSRFSTQPLFQPPPQAYQAPNGPPQYYQQPQQNNWVNPEAYNGNQPRYGR